MSPFLIQRERGVGATAAFITILSFIGLRGVCNRIASGCGFDHNLVTITVYAIKELHTFEHRRCLSPYSHSDTFPLNRAEFYLYLPSPVYDDLL